MKTKKYTADDNGSQVNEAAVAYARQEAPMAAYSILDVDYNLVAEPLNRVRDLSGRACIRNRLFG